MKKKMLFVAGMLVSALFVWLSFRNARIEDVLETLGDSDPSWALPFLALLFLFYWLKTTRWKLLLSPTRDVKSIDLFPTIMIGYAWTAILPMQMGELVRAYIAGKQFGLPYSLVLGTIGLERIFDLLTILLLFGLATSISESIPNAYTSLGLVILILTFTAAALCALLVTKTDKVLATIDRCMSWFPPRISKFSTRQLSAVASGVASIARPRLISRIGANSLLQWLLMGGCIWVSLIAVGIDASLPAALLVLVATIVGISLPTSPGYIGNIQFAFVASLTVYDIEPTQAVAASIYYHVIAYVAVVVTGFGYMKSIGLDDLILPLRDSVSVRQADRR